MPLGVKGRGARCSGVTTHSEPPLPLAGIAALTYLNLMNVSRAVAILAAVFAEATQEHGSRWL